MMQLTGRPIATGLRFPEGPTVLPDGRVAVVEIAAGTIAAYERNGIRSELAAPGGGPNGLALGPEGDLYVCNNGGLGWIEGQGLLLPRGQARDYERGRIEVVDLQTGAVRRLYDSCDGRALCGPNDLVFAPDDSPSAGGFWFTDLGKNRERDRDFGAVYWAASDGTSLIEAAHPIAGGANGVGLSPDGTCLYVAETETGRLWTWPVEGPGQLAREPWPSQHGGRLLYAPGGGRRFDSLALTAAGNIVIATLVTGELATVSSEGVLLDILELPDCMPTNICFGGPDLETAYITLSSTGVLVEMTWPEPGLRLAY